MRGRGKGRNTKGWTAWTAVSDPLLLLLIFASLVLLVAVLYGVVDLVAYLRSGHALFEAGGGGLSRAGQIWTLVSIVLFVAVAWGLWLVARRRQVDQLRLRRSEERYRNIINHAGEAIFLLDDQGRVLEWNKASEALFAVPRRDVLHKPFKEIHLCYGVEIEQAMADASRLGRSLTFEFPLRRRGQAEHGEISLTVSPIAAASGPGGLRGLGRPRSFVVIARDISREKQMETRMSETEKLAGIGQFAAGIAHQLNTPLGSILLSAQMLEEAEDDPDQLEDVQRIIRQTEQCRGIIKGLLNFARPSGQQKGRVMLAEVVRETIFLMEKAVRAQNVKIVLDIEDEGMVFGNRNEIEQVVFNLLANALDALPQGGTVSISIRGGETGEVELRFTDTGEGVPEADRDRIFLPFFTTKEYGKGTGLGLSIVARIVHEHGGRIELLEGRGARFLMVFPRYRSSSHDDPSRPHLALVNDLDDGEDDDWTDGPGPDGRGA